MKAEGMVLFVYCVLGLTVCVFIFRDRREENRQNHSLIYPDIQLLNPAHIMCRINKPPHPVSNRHFGIENVQKYDTIFNKMFKSN